jgi:hypothetical protein
MSGPGHKGLFEELDDNMDIKGDNFANLEDAKHGLFSGLKGVGAGLAAKFKGRSKEVMEPGEEEEEEDEKELSSDDGEEDDDDDDAVTGPAVEGTYDAAEWEDLEVRVGGQCGGREGAGSAGGPL